jgi:hypothetical protein
MQKKSIILSIILLLISGIYWLKSDIYWRKYNDNSIKVEVANNLAINKLEILWQDLTDTKTIFKNGKQITDFNLQPEVWDIIYADSFKAQLSGKISSDKRQDFNYHFSLFNKNDTLFCAFKTTQKNCIFCDNKTEIVPLTPPQYKQQKVL